MPTATDALSIFPAPPDLLQPRIVLSARPIGDARWQDIPVMIASSISDHPHGAGGCEGWAYCSADGPIECRVRFTDPIDELRIRPSLAEPILFEHVGSTAHFQLDQPRYVVIESGPMRRGDGPSTPRFTVYLLVDGPDRDAPDPRQPGVRILHPGLHDPRDFDPGHDSILYLLPGIHDVRGQMIHLQPHRTLYLSGGAHLRSYIRGDEADGTAIRGRGVIDGTGVACKSREWRDDGDAGFVFLRRGRDITIDGPIIYDCPFWNIVTFGTVGTTVRNHKAITWRVNNDGIQPRSCNRMRVDHCFLKCADDCIAVKTRRAAGMISRDLMFRDLVLWNDVPGNTVEIGHTSQADLLEQVRFEDIHLVHCDTRHADNGFAVSITLIDHCTVQDVAYRRLFIEGVRSGDFRLRIGTSRYTTDNERGHIRRILFEDVHMDGAPTYSRIEGFDDTHAVEDVVFRNVTASTTPSDGGPCAALADLNITAIHTRHLRIETGDARRPHADRV